MTNNDIKYFEATRLKDFLYTLDYKQRILFKLEVVQLANIKKQTFANWLAMACRIPVNAKAVIESVAGKKLFDNIQNDSPDI